MICVCFIILTLKFFQLYNTANIFIISQYHYNFDMSIPMSTSCYVMLCYVRSQIARLSSKRDERVHMACLTDCKDLYFRRVCCLFLSIRLCPPTCLSASNFNFILCSKIKKFKFNCFFLFSSPNFFITSSVLFFPLKFIHFFPGI